MKKKKREIKKEEYSRSLIGYTLGIIAIVLSFFLPAASLVLAIIGLIQSSREKTTLALKGKRLNIIALILSIIILAFSIVAYLSGSQYFPAI